MFFYALKWFNSTFCSNSIIENGWRELERITIKQSEVVEYLFFLEGSAELQDDINAILMEGCCTFPDLLCPKASALKNKEGLYYHANNLSVLDLNGNEKEIILSQQPHPGAIENFLSLIFLHNDIIIDLRDHNDLNNLWGVDYIGQVGYTSNYSKITVSTLSKLEHNAFSRFKIALKYTGEKTKFIEVWQYREWKDNDIVSKDELRKLRKIINAKIPSNSILIHCRAGVGRSGVVICYLALFNKFISQKKEIQHDLLIQEVVTTISQLRAQRGAKLVQTKKQFELIVNTLEDDLLLLGLLKS